MTRTTLENIHGVLLSFWYFLSDFRALYFQNFWYVPILLDVTDELMKLTYDISQSFLNIFYWWDYLRTEPTFLDDLWHVLLYLMLGVQNYVLLRGDPGGIGRIVYFPAWATYYTASPIVNVIAYLNDWYITVTGKLEEILNWDVLKSYILSWLPSLEDAINWFIDRWQWFQGEVTNWWNVTKLTVQSWIAIAKEALQLQIDNLMGLWLNLQVAWDEWKLKIPSFDELWLWFTDWWAEILKPLTTWWNERLVELDTLINDTIKNWFPFYDDLVELWEDIKIFFTDPLGWLEARFTDWFLGPEE